MDPQRPPAPYSATYTHPSQPYHQPSPNTSSDDCDYDYDYSEKDTYHTPHKSHSARASKASNRRAHDSVISHPLSPKLSTPPSPTSSVSSAGRQHRGIQEIQHAPATHDVACPPPAHLDPEKHDYGSSQGGQRSANRASGLDADAIVYDQGEYHEKGPEEKAWQLLVGASADPPNHRTN